MNLVLTTPVDEGVARANYRIGLGKAVEGTIETGSTANVAIRRAQKKIEQFDLAIHKRLHITNNLPYIDPLNRGSSSQAPANFIELAIQQGVVESSGFRILP